MGSSQRGSVALALAVLVAGCSVPIAAGLDEGDANQAVVALEKSGIAADKYPDPDRDGRWLLSVARDEASAAVGVLAEEGLPPRSGPGVLDALGQSSLVPSRTAEHAKLVTGIAGDLERTLRGVDGVLSARVHIAMPPKGALGEAETTAPTASVLLRHRGATPPIAAADVQRLVAGAVPGLSQAQVSVVATPVPPSARPAERELARFGPVTVTRASLAPLRLIVGAAVIVNALLVGALLALWSRTRRRELELAEVRAVRDTSPRRAESSAA
jgi:type III secretion protein J